uniref:Putative secreted protein n=1 Tax=Ixodes scapularis TaxID=6945 RepID=A0A4D5RXE7_IXOSC
MNLFVVSLTTTIVCVFKTYFFFVARTFDCPTHLLASLQTLLPQCQLTLERSNFCTKCRYQEASIHINMIETGRFYQSQHRFVKVYMRDIFLLEKKVFF